MRDSGELAIAKLGIGCTVDALTADQEFGIVFSDRGVIKFPASGAPAEATPEGREAGLQWLAGVPGGGGSCVREGLLAILEIANRSSVSEKSIIYIGDGGGTCAGQNEASYLNQTLAAVREANTKDIPIHAVAVLTPGARNLAFLEELVEDSGGELVQAIRN